MGGKVYNGDETVYFGIGQRLVRQPGYRKIPKESQEILRRLDPIGTPRGFTVFASEKRQERIEVRPEGVVLFHDPDPEKREVQFSTHSKPNLILRGVGDLVPLIEADLPQHYQRGGKER